MVQGDEAFDVFDVRFTSKRAKLMRDIIDMYIEGIPDAQSETIKDNSLGDLETLLKVCGGYTETMNELIEIRKQLVREGK